MLSGAVMSRALDSLPPRPPTPPKEAQHDACPPPRLVLGSVDTRPNVHTPPGVHSPGDSSTTNSTTRRSRKKVEFSAKAEYKDPPIHIEGETKPQHPTPVSLPRSASKPVKSILKVTQYTLNPLASANGNACDPSTANLAEMLESTIQQLAGGDRDSKVDAYVMLARACKASNNLPDRVALQEKMSLFVQFIQRDIVTKPQEGTADASLVNHALNLLITFLGFPSIAAAINNDFGTFIIDHCVRYFDDVSVPKDVARHLMKVISLQNFSPKVMTAERVGRLISSLHNIKGQRAGKSIVMSRVLIYRKLVKQCKPLMVVHSDWLFDLFLDMLSSLKEIRVSAINLGLEAAFSIGHDKRLTRKVMEIFNTTSEEKQYIEFYREKLESMAKDRHESAIVPDIWSVVVLLLRSTLYKWESCKPWLEILQSCFNSPDFPTKINANRAWCRLVYLMNSEEGPFRKNLPTLAAPLIIQVRRKGLGKMTEDLRAAVLGAICNLFYYAFKPSTNTALLDNHWDSSVKPIVAALLDPKPEAASDNAAKASHILRGLLDCRTPRRWRDDHVVDSPLAKPEELPQIDPKWVRGNIRRVLDAVGPILERDFLALASSDSATYKLWEALVTTVASAASKEIKVSKETGAFVAEALSVLQKIWARGQPTNNDSQMDAANFLLATRAFLELMITSLGHLPFTEKPGKTHVLVKAPLYTLFSMLSNPPPPIPDDDFFAEFFTSIFSPFLDSKGDKARMDLAQELLAVIPMESLRPYGPWLLVSESILAWLGPGHNSHGSTASGSDIPLGNDYREIVRVLERGLRSTPNLPWERWESLFRALFERVRDETGHAGFALVTIEPLSKALLDQVALGGLENLSKTCVGCVTELVSVATQPRDRQAFDAARRRLWGTALAGGRTSSFDPFDHFYRVVSETLERLYEGYKPDDSDAVVRLLKEIGGFFDRCNRQLFPKALAGLQDGFLPWVYDGKRLLTSQSSAVLAMTKSLWDKVGTLVADMEHPDQQLESLERFFCASFDSSHRNIANTSVSLWNRLFERAQHLEYPEKLKAALSRLQPHVDMVLPGLELSGGDYAGQQPMFLDSVDELSLPKLPSTSSSRRGTPRPLSSHGKSPDPSVRTVQARPKYQRTAGTKSSDTSRRDTAPRLRHDDSQLRFAAIETSPLGSKQAESQVLTEHQREVRERQKENAALFPEIQSSPGPKQREADLPARSRGISPNKPSRSREVATPEPEGAFDSYISSTPTPRRGQPVLISEHDMPDLPSSPPEPRGNPLAAEIRSRSASNSLLDHWEFSSSPVSGSPNPSRRVPIVGPSDTDDVALVDNGPHQETDQDLPSPGGAGIDEDVQAKPDVVGDELAEDTILPDIPLFAPMQSPQPAAGSAPTTPRRQARSKVVQETPKSENEHFVDAPSSPLPPTPKRSERLAKTTKVSRLRATERAKSRSPSLGVSDTEERSSTRLVVELNSGKVNSSDYMRPSASPDKNAQRVEAQDCIVVGDSPKKSTRKPLSLGRKTSSTTPAMLLATDEDRIPSSQSKSQEGRQKRKRRSSKAYEASSRKRRQYTPPVDEAMGPSEVPDSQPSSAIRGPVPNQLSDSHLTTSFEETTSASQSFEDRIPSSPIDSSQPIRLDIEDGLEEADNDEQLVDLLDVKSSQLHDKEAQSQIELESRKQREERGEQQAGPAAEAMEVDTDQPAASEEGERERQATPSQSYVQKFISMLRNGTELLLSAQSASTEEAWEADDALIEVTRALHEAKRRWRQ